MFEELLEAHYQRLLRYVQRRIDPRLERRVGADAVLHDGLEAARRRWEAGERPEDGAGYIWLFRTVQDQLTEAWRFHARGKRDLKRDAMPVPAASSVQMVMGLVAAGPSPSGDAANRELGEQVREVLDRLDGTDCQIIELRGLAEMSFREIGAILGMPGNSACQRYRRALERFKREWDTARSAEGAP
jgi:RNA polymerase sigma factor (sigma-70 family)